MLTDVIEVLRCPACAAGFITAGHALRCERGHTFDIARQGYVNLSGGGAGVARGDTAAMVAARAAFLEAGHFASLAHEIAAVAASAVAHEVDGPAGGAGPPSAPAVVADVGAGTGYYLARVLDGLSDRGHDAVGLALDASKYAARQAARAHPHVGAVVCDTWDALPVRNGSATLVLNVFAPRNATEFARVLKPGGALVVVTPTARHLMELVEPLGLLGVDPRKEERVARQLEPVFGRADRHNVELSLVLSQADVIGLVAMGPSAWHAQEGALAEKLAAQPGEILVTLSTTIDVYRRSAFA